MPLSRSNRPIPPQLKSRVDRELEPSEQILWIDTPIPQFFNPGSTGIFLFSIPWTCFAVFWTIGAWEQSENWSFALFGAPLLAVGFGMLLTPVWTYRKALATAYVITDQRAISFDGGWKTTIRSYPPAKLGNVYRREKQGGTGDVMIARRMWRDSDGDRQTEELGFLNIENPREIERLLKQLANECDHESE